MCLWRRPRHRCRPSLPALQPLGLASQASGCRGWPGHWREPQLPAVSQVLSELQSVRQAQSHLCLSQPRSSGRLLLWAAACVALRLSTREAGSCYTPPASKIEVLSRRGLAIGAAAAASLDVLPARAILGLFEGPKVVPYTMPGVFNISMPPDYVLKKSAPGLLAWQGDRIQPVEVMTAKSKAVDFASLAEALGSNATEVGERMAKVRPAVRVNSTTEATLVEALVDPAGSGLDIYQFEWISDFIHELKLYALVKGEGKNYLCSVNLRTAALLWEDRQELFRSIMASFAPLETQPKREAAAAAPA
ncbi:unnamed protein product [Effrenium voratum]|nr:unnamed protein product [Effrenium voratum]